MSALFDSSWALQSLVYTHKTTRAIEMMIAEAMEKADGHFHFYEAKDDPEKLLMLTDCVFHKILDAKEGDDPDLIAAKDILQRIQKRKLYQFCGQTSALPKDEQPSYEQRARTATVDHQEALRRVEEDRKRRNELCKRVKQGILQWQTMNVEISGDDIRVEVIAILYGKGEVDPLDTIDFVNKRGKPVERSAASKGRGVFRKSFKDEYIRVYARDADQKQKKLEITNRFYKWCVQNGYDVPKDMEKVPIEHDDPIEMSED